MEMTLKKTFKCKILSEKKSLNKIAKCINYSYFFNLLNYSQFYELCFNIKKKMFPDNHLAKYANIPALYDEVIKRGLPPETYHDFIYNELSKNA